MAVSLVPNGPSGGPFTPSSQTPDRLPDRKGGTKARVPQRVNQPSGSNVGGWHSNITSNTNNNPTMINNNLKTEDKRKTRIVISQGECVIRKSTSYPAQKNLVGMIAEMADTDGSDDSSSSTQEVMHKIVTSPSPTGTMTTQTQSSLAKALLEVAHLHKERKLTDEEYIEAKTVIINANPPSSVSLGHIMDNSDNIDYQPGYPRKAAWNDTYSPRSASPYNEEPLQSTYRAAYQGVNDKKLSQQSYRDELDRQEHKVAALMDENTGLRQVAEKLQYQLKASGGSSPKGRLSESPRKTVSISTLSDVRDGEFSMSPRRVGVTPSSFSAAVSDKFTSNPFSDHFNAPSLPPPTMSKSALPPTSPSRPSFDATAALRSVAASPPPTFNSQPATPLQKSSKPQLRLPTRSPHRLSSPTVSGEAEWSLSSLRSPR